MQEYIYIMQQHTMNIEQYFNQISNIPDRNQNRGLRWSLKIFLFLMEMLSVSKDPGPISRQIHKDS